MTRRELLAAAIGGSLASRAVGRRVIFIELSGGASHVDTFDLQVGPWTPSWMRPIRFGDTQFPAGLMPRLAARPDRVKLVRGLRSSSLRHRSVESGWPFLRATAATFENCCEQARGMIHDGAAQVHIHLGSWDHHGNLYEQLRVIGSSFDAGTAGLIDGLDRDRVLGSTRVVAMSEFGRRPGPLNQNGGRDHFPQHAALLAGGHLLRL